MPWIGGKYVPDQRSPMERLYGFQKTQADMQALRQQQDMLRERQKILAESYSAGQPGGMNVAFESPAEAVKGSGILDMLGYQAPEQVKVDMQPAGAPSFDAESAINRLYSIGDIQTAQGLAAAQEKQNRDLNRWSGAVTYIDDPENPGVTIAVQPSTQGDGPGYRKIGVAAMTPEARARQKQKDEDQALDREKIGMDRQRFLFEQRKFYEGPEVQARQQQLEDAAKKGASAANTLNVIATIEPYLDVASGSDLEKMARKGGSFLGFDSAAATADRMIEQGAAALTLAAPKLGGAASDRDVALYERSMGALSGGTTQQKREAIKVIKQLLGQYGEAAAGQPGQQQGRPAPAPKAAPAPKVDPAAYRRYEAAIRAANGDPRKIEAINARARQNGVIR